VAISIRHVLEPVGVFAITSHIPWKRLVIEIHAETEDATRRVKGLARIVFAK